MMTDTEKQIRKIIASELSLEDSALTDDSTLDSLQATTNDFSGIWAELEDEFDICLTIEEFSPSHTLQEIVSTIEEKL